MKKITLLIALLFLTYIAQAQYHTWGLDRASVRWSSIADSTYKLIYPRNFEKNARKIGGYISALSSADKYGFENVKLQRIPIILHTQNSASNGMVAWAPKSMELTTIAPMNISSVPWLKQLAAHEYRHVVQMSALNRNTTKLLGYILGQQAVGATAAILPRWFLEGDATAAETQLTENGRGKEPEFSIEYRGIFGSQKDDKYPVDKFFCGSYKDKIPDWYHMGYQMVSWGNTHYGADMWNKITTHISKYPFLIVNPWIVMRRDYKTSSTKIFKNTFKDLNSLWEPIAQHQNSTTIIPTKIRSYSTYKEPIMISDSVCLAVLEDFTDLRRIVRVDFTDMQHPKQTTLAYVNRISSRIDFDGENIYWTEYKPSTFWDQDIGSVLCKMNLKDLKVKRIRDKIDKYILCPTPIGDNKIAYIAYDYENGYTIVSGSERKLIGDDISLHGLTWDNKSQKLYYMGLSDQGMGIFSLDGDTIKRPAYITLNSLRAKDSWISFTSTQSGLDEGHAINLNTKQEYQLTSSRYGSKSPACSPFIATTYTPDGYMLSTLSDSSAITPVNYQRVSDNKINAQYAQWNTLKLDTLQIDDYEPVKPSKRYRKATNLFNFHSWAPLSYDPQSIMNERQLDINLGVTALSQSLLGDARTMLNYSFVDGQYSMIRGRFEYLGFAPKIELSATYGGGRRINYEYRTDDSIDKNYFALNARIYLPIRLSSGNWSRVLTPDISLRSSNTIYYHDGHARYSLNLLSLRLNYSVNRQMAYRDFLPKWGYTIQFEHLGDVRSKDYWGSAMVLYMKGYLPGIMPNHSTMIRVAAQSISSGLPVRLSTPLMPIGVAELKNIRQAVTAAIDYQFVIAYPDGGIPDVLYFKRIRANLFAGALLFSPMTLDTMYQRSSIRYKPEFLRHSYGCDLILDVNPFASTYDTTLKLTIARPSDTKRVHVMFGAAVSF